MGGRKAEFLDFDQDSGTPGKEKLNTFLLVRKNDEQHLRGEVKAEAPVQNELLQKSKPSIGRITPSPLMERLAAFIPQIKQANEELQSREPRSYCIDLLGADDDYNEQSGEAALPLGDPEDTGTPMIEMNLGLGVYEGKHGATEEDEGGLHEIRLPRKERKGIVVLDGDTSSSDDDFTAS